MVCIHTQGPGSASMLRVSFLFFIGVAANYSRAIDLFD